MALSLRVAAAPLVLLLGGCATWPPGGSEEELVPPVIEVVNDRSTFELVPWSGCISGSTVGMCWDGSPEHPVDVGVVAGELEVALEVASPLDGWRWEAVARDPAAEPGVGANDGRQALTVEHDDSARRLVLTVPPGGPFAVDLWGRGESGDASYTFIAVGVS
ncbi:hypothetical protein ATJ97_1955 [Georgenia soli]|uniref:Secreted protein n=1 Tax=Georgenia soli TaxID=638953 RepID=A0A2A9EML3_9MICO|nr:hypothetical protein [Georgenia soli]PFG39449.1 hypothetical protein ATJ97_1955 [Georgenia soli]